jgi:hypothetical protein
MSKEDRAAPSADAGLKVFASSLVDGEPVAYALMLWLSRRTAPLLPRTGADQGSL